MKLPDMKSKTSEGALLSHPQLLRALGFLLSITAAYFLTIQSIKVELASKAEHEAVAMLDKKLTNIEVILKEGVIDKESFYTFTTSVEKRLTTIELLLENKNGR